MTAEPYQLSTSLPRGSEEVRHLSRKPKAETQMNTTHDGLRLWFVPPRAAPGAVGRPCREGRRHWDPILPIKRLCHRMYQHSLPEPVWQLKGIVTIMAKYILD